MQFTENFSIVLERKSANHVTVVDICAAKIWRDSLA